MAGLYDLMDEAIAYELGVTMEEYIKRIEELPFTRAAVVIGACLEENEELRVKARRIFKNCRTKIIGETLNKNNITK
jgi:hypothetical protein